MTAEIKAKMEAYRKRKEANLRRDENMIEGIRWNLTKTIVEIHPSAEFQWMTLEGPVFLEVRVKLGDYVWSYKFDRIKTLDAPGFIMSLAITDLLTHMEFDPLRQMFT